MRTPVIATLGLGLALFAGTLHGAGPAAARPGLQAATPAASPAAAAPAETPAAVAVATVAAPAAATPAAPPAETATNVVTLTAWYANDPSGDFINIVPIRVDASLATGPEPNAAPIGRADFPEEGAPTLQIGDTRFDSYARSEGDVPERWTWFDDAEGARPATLVLQVSAAGGAYDGYYGTATFISRDEGGAGGVLVLALRPPSAPATGPAASGGEQDVAAAAQAAASDEAAIMPSPDVEPPTDVLTEPGA